MNFGKESSMKSLASAVLLSCLALACASRAPAAENKPDPSQYALPVHVSASEYAAASNGLSEILTVTVAGKHYQLQGPTSSARIFAHGNGLINPGDYHAKLTQDDHKTSYESLQEFEILLPDGTTRRFIVVAQSE
jgi:hypothetical protein